MNILFFLKGIIIGFGMAVPIGPIGIICIRKTLLQGRTQGQIVGLGAATADLCYSCVAVFGITIISDFIAHERLWIRVIGGILLLIIGVKTFMAKPNTPVDDKTEARGWHSYISTLILTLSNPLTFFAFIAIFSALGVEKSFGFWAAFSTVLGVFIGSWGWFWVLTTFVNRYRQRVGMNSWVWINKIAGVIIFVSGSIALGGLLV